MAYPELSWLPEAENARARLAALARGGDFEELTRLAQTRLDFVRTNGLDQILRRRWPERPAGFDGRTVRLAILSSSTTAHLAPSLRVAGLRAGLWLEIHEADYGQYRQALDDPALSAFRPDAVLFALDAETLSGGVGAANWLRTSKPRWRRAAPISSRCGARRARPDTRCCSRRRCRRRRR